MRTIQELEARLALLYAASFKNIRILDWDSFTGNKATITLDAAGENFQRARDTGSRLGGVRHSNDIRRVVG